MTFRVISHAAEEISLCEYQGRKLYLRTSNIRSITGQNTEKIAKLLEKGVEVYNKQIPKVRDVKFTDVSLANTHGVVREHRLKQIPQPGSWESENIHQGRGWDATKKRNKSTKPRSQAQPYRGLPVCRFGF